MEYNLENKIKKEFSNLGWALIISNIIGYLSINVYMRIVFFFNYKDLLNINFDYNNLTANQFSIGVILMALSKYTILHIYNEREGIKTIDLIDGKGISIKAP